MIASAVPEECVDGDAAHQGQAAGSYAGHGKCSASARVGPPLLSGFPKPGEQYANRRGT